MAARLFGGLLAGALALAGVPASAQHHEEPARKAAKAAPHQAAPNTHGPTGGGSLGHVAPEAPAVAPAAHGRTKAAAPTDGEHAHGGSEPAAAGGRRKVDVLRKTNSPADVAASINERLAELAELRRTAPVAPARRLAPKRESPAPAVATATAAPPRLPEPPTLAPIRLTWRVPVSWPDEMSAPAHRPGLTSSAGVP